MTGKSFHELMNGYLDNRLTEEELADFLRLMQEDAHQKSLQETIDRLLSGESLAGSADKSRADTLFQKIMGTADAQKEVAEEVPVYMMQKERRFSWLRIAAAASVIGLLLLTAFLWTNKRAEPETVQTAAGKKEYADDVLPGGDKATLTLADGSVIVLDEAANGQLARQGSAQVIKLDGKLAYNAAGKGSSEIVYNTIATPRGGQYQIELPDGSRVWLNAASSLRFPTAFTGGKRSVEVKGEAYFEVAQNKALPFVVQVNGAEIQVLGTHFNVMAYAEEEAVKTTLLEGSVRFEKGNSSALLKPGQQSQLTDGGQINVVSGVDIEQVVAWKNGMFYFENAGIETIMRQLSRWYDIEVEFRQKNGTDLFVMEMPRSSKLSDVLRVLELTGNIQFDIKGKKVTVMP